MSLDVRYLGLGDDLVDYRDGWDLQHQRHAEVVSGAAPDTLLLLEHAPVYTAGKRTEAHERPLDETPVVDVDRGGKITWHGPGQLVGYPLVRLPEAFGVVDYVRRLEQALIDALTELGLATGRVPGRSGVWLPADPSTGSGNFGGRPDRKIAAIGVRVAGGVTMHGFALNADPDLTAFDRIVPCGIADAGVTSIAAELGTSPALTSLAYVLVPHLERLLAFAPYEKTPDVAALPEPAPSGPTYGLTVSVG
ncbi:MAG: lipoyl(octanoyl) transferase LipB [Janthinobacterium lividum]